MIHTLVERYQRVARLELVLVLFLSTLVLAGWLFDIDELKKGLVNSVSMNPLTSVICVFAVLAITLMNSFGHYHKLTGQLISCLIALIGIIRIAELGYGNSSSLAFVLFKDKVTLDRFAGLPNVIAPNTAFCLLFTGISMVLYPVKFKKNNLIADWFAIFTACLSFGSLIGYLYEDNILYTTFGTLPMSFPTALAFSFLSTAILLYRSEVGMFRIFTKYYPGSRMARYLVPIAILLPVASGLLRRYGLSQFGVSSSFGLAMVLMINLVFMIFLILRGARSMNHSYLDLEKERKKAEMLNARLLKEETKLLKQTLMETQIRQQRELIQATIDGQEKQKKEIGMELHDHINQVLASTKLYLELAKSDESIRADVIDKCRQQIIYVINEIRNLSRTLVLHDSGQDSILENIAALINTLQQGTGLQIHTQISGEVLKLLDKKQQVSIYRIMEEQLQNVVKHSHATHVHIHLWQDGGNIRLLMYDNGKGFDMKQKQKGIGLNNMGSRVASMDGELEIVSAPDQGCELRISIPAEVRA